MLSMNQVTLVGRLGQDVEKQATASGVSVAKLSLATSFKRKDQYGNQQEHTDWHRVILFGQNADNAARMLCKGSCVLIQGEIRYHKYQDKTSGQDRWSVNIEVGMRGQFILIKDGRPIDAPRPQEQPSQQQQYQQRQQQQNNYPSPTLDDIPF